MIYEESAMRPAIQTAFDEGGLDAVCSLVVRLLNEQEARHQAAMAKLEARISELEKSLGKNSSNSGKPPSSDGLRRTSSLRQNTSGRKPGGQPGHAGQTLRPSPAPDLEIRIPHDKCPNCSCDLSGHPAEGAETRQVFELPPIALKVTAYQAERKTCPGCQRRSTAGFPAEAAAPTQYGPAMRAVMSYLQCAQFLPHERVADVCEDLFGHRPSAGSVVSAVARCAEAVQPCLPAIIVWIQAAAVAGADETGVRCANKTNWIHVACTETATLYTHSLKRGLEGIVAGGALADYKGILVHDFWAPYEKLEHCSHSRCCAHLLRELKACGEEKGAEWAGELSVTLVDMKKAAAEALAASLTEVPAEQRAALEKRYDEAVGKGLAAHPEQAKPAGQAKGRGKQSVERNLLCRMSDKRAEVLLFFHDLRVPFDNNQAERDIRMMKVQQKVSGCFRSVAGAAGFCAIRSYLSTARKQGLNALSVIKNAFLGNPACFSPAPPY
jgi:transposase